MSRRRIKPTAYREAQKAERKQQRRDQKAAEIARFEKMQNRRKAAVFMIAAAYGEQVGESEKEIEKRERELDALIDAGDRRALRAYGINIKEGQSKEALRQLFRVAAKVEERAKRKADEEQAQQKIDRMDAAQ